MCIRERGVVVYLNQEGRGIGLMEKMKAYKVQEEGMDTVDANICLGHLADERDYGAVSYTHLQRIEEHHTGRTDDDRILHPFVQS